MKQFMLKAIAGGVKSLLSPAVLVMFFLLAVGDLAHASAGEKAGAAPLPEADTALTADIPDLGGSAIYQVQFLTDGTVGATITPAAVQWINSGDSTQKVRANAPAGFRFVKWTLDGVDYAVFNNLIVPNVTKAMTFVAHFGTWAGYTGQVGVVNLTSQGLQLLDPLTNTFYGPYFKDEITTQSDSGLYDAVMTSDGKTALVSNFVNCRISFIDLSDPGNPQLDPNHVILSFYAEDIALTPDGRYALVTDGSFSERIAVIDVPSRTVTQDLVTPGVSSQAVAVGPDGKTVLTVDSYGRKVNAFLLDTVAGTVKHTGPLDLDHYLPINVEFSPNGKTAIVANVYSTSPTLLGANPVILSVDAPGTVTLRGDVPLPLDVRVAQSVVFSRRTGDKAYYYAVRTTSPTMEVVDHEIHVLNVNGPGNVSHSGITIPLSWYKGSSPWFGVDTIAIDSSGRYLYASNMSGSDALNQLSVVDLQTNTELTTLSVVDASNVFPAGLAFPAFDVNQVLFETDGTPGASFLGDPTQIIPWGTDCRPVTAIAPPGYRFLKWTREGADYAFRNKLIVPNVTEPMTFVAHFEPWAAYTGQVGVVNLTSQGLTLLDPLTNSFYGPYFGDEITSTSDHALLDAAMTPDGKTALVSNFGGRRISFVDLSNPGDPQLDPTSITLSFFAEDIALTPDGKHAIVTDGGGSEHIAVIDVPSRTLTQDLVTSDVSHQAVAVAADGRTVLTVDYWQRKVNAFLLNPVTGTLQHTGPVDLDHYRPVNVEFSPDGKTAIVANASSTSPTLLGGNPVFLSVDAPGTVTLRGDVPLPLEVKAGQSVVFSRRTGGKAYYYATRWTTATLEYTNEIHVLDISGPGEVSHAGVIIPLSGFHGSSQLFGVDTMAIEPSGRYLYVSNMTMSAARNQLSVVDLQTDTEVTTLSVVNIPDPPPPQYPEVVPIGIAFPAFDLWLVHFQTDGTPGASFTGSAIQMVTWGMDCAPVTAVAPTGYHFAGWSGDVTSAANPLTVTHVTSDMIIVANFTADAGIKIRTPGPSTTWPLRAYMPVAWTCSDFPTTGTLIIQLRKAGAIMVELARVPLENGDGQKIVRLPAYAGPAGDYQIRLLRDGLPLVQDWSPYFTVTFTPSRAEDWRMYP
jgi:DNA-binding beta-propeller fold protein YncE